jgi:hypothetical protein
MCDRLTSRMMVECIRYNDDYCSCMYVLMWCHRRLLSCDRLTVIRRIFVIYLVCVLSVYVV